MAAESLPSQLRKLRKRSGLTLEELAQDAGYKRASSIQRYFSDDYEAKYLDLEVAQRFAKALVGKAARGEKPIVVDEVLALAGISSLDKVVVTHPDIDHQNVVPFGRRGNKIVLAPGVTIAMRPVRVVGAVQAGVWLSTVEWPPEDQYDLPLPIQTGFDSFNVIGLVVRGPSMDLVYPSGSILACVKFIDIDLHPRSGQRVVALRHRHGETEATVKEFRIDGDGKARLWPRSTHPDFQAPIPVEPPADEAEELQVAYLVIGSYRPEV